MKTRAGGWVMSSSPTLSHLASPANTKVMDNSFLHLMVSIMNLTGQRAS